MKSRRTRRNNNIKIFFDCEFTGLRKDTTLISIGFITNDRRTFYAEFTDYNESMCNDWIKNNVIDNLKFNDNEASFLVQTKNKTAEENDLIKSHPAEDDDEGFNIVMKGNRRDISIALNKWLNQFVKENLNIEFVSDVCHYDFVLLVDLLLIAKGEGLTAIDLDKEYSSCCYDLNIDIATFLSTNARKAFNVNRESLLKRLYENKKSDKDYSYIMSLLSNREDKHNSLYDAKIIKELYTALHRTNKFFS